MSCCTAFKHAVQVQRFLGGWRQSLPLLHHSLAGLPEEAVSHDEQHLGQAAAALCEMSDDVC